MAEKNVTDDIIDAEYVDLEEHAVKIDGIEEVDVQKVVPIVKSFLSSYAKKSQDISMTDWLITELKNHLGEKTGQELREMSNDIISGVTGFTRNLDSLNKACAEGQTKEGWLKAEMQRAAEQRGIDIQKYGDYLFQIQQVISDSNDVMMEALQSKGGIIRLNDDGTALPIQTPTNDWNTYNTTALALNIGQNASLSGIGSAAFSAGYQLALRAAKGEQIDGADIIEAALLAGKDEEIKEAAAGALKVSIEKGMLPLLPKSLSMNAVSNIACIGIENGKIFSRLANGEINGVQALELMARNMVATVSGLSCEGMGAAIGASLFSFVPVVGTTVGGIVGGIVGQMASSKLGQAIQNGIQKIKPVAVSWASSAYDKIRIAAKSVENFLCSGVKKVLSFFGV